MPVYTSRHLNNKEITKLKIDRTLNLIRQQKLEWVLHPRTDMNPDSRYKVIARVTFTHKTWGFIVMSEAGEVDVISNIQTYHYVKEYKITSLRAFSNNGNITFKFVGNSKLRDLDSFDFNTAMEIKQQSLVL